MRYSFLAILFVSPGLFAIEPPAAGLPRLSGFCCSISTLSNVGFISGYSSAHGQPAWVFHEIRTPVFKSKRSGNFRSDKRLKFPIQPSVFNRSGFDRGHMAPARDIGAIFGPDAQRESFLMSNISPQRPTLNRKIWRNIESWCWSSFSASTTSAIVFGEYLATLTVEQIDAYLLLLESDKAMENSSRDSFIALLKELRTDRAEADAQAIMALSPLVSSVQTIQTLDEQIEALERIAKEL